MMALMGIPVVFPPSRCPLSLSGEAEHAGLPAAVPPGRVLLLRPAEGAGGSQRHLDRRVCHAEAEVQDRQLHTYLLDLCFLCLRRTSAVASNKYRFLFKWSGH